SSQAASFMVFPSPAAAIIAARRKKVKGSCALSKAFLYGIMDYPHRMQRRLRAMRLTLECYVLLFFTGAFLGWVLEVVCKLIQFGRFINRGFLIGPYCPIYGFGAVLVTALLTPFSASPPAVFVMAMAVC